MSNLNRLQNLFKGYGNTLFTNQPYRDLKVNYENFFDDAETGGIDFEKPLLNQVQRVSFELSNLCNYSAAHKKCPASRVTAKKTLPTEVVVKVLAEMSAIGYSGVFAFHRYNEPLMDPRLFTLIEKAKGACPESKVLILSNGFYLTQTMADELSALGVGILAVSAYSRSEFERLSSLQVKIPYRVFCSVLDDREDIYSGTPLDLKAGCLAPLRDLTVSVDGKIVLCCLDWQNRYEFGDLNRFSLSEIINGSDFIDRARELSQSGRTLDICRRCSMSR